MEKLQNSIATVESELAKLRQAGAIEVGTVLTQVTGGKRYVMYPRTVAANVDMGDGTDMQTRIRTIERSLSGNTTVHVAENITARDSIVGMIPGDKCVVLDATSDPTVERGSAEYIWMPAVGDAGPYWRKLTEEESQDRVTTWEDVQGRPTQPVAAIDAAALQAHEHDNKCLLDQLAKDENGLLTIGGKPVDDGKRDTVVTSGPVETIPTELRDGGLLITIE